jgi:hypothetical protein
MCAEWLIQQPLNMRMPLLEVEAEVPSYGTDPIDGIIDVQVS